MKIKTLILKENEANFNSNIIHNLSSYDMRPNEFQLLSKGLNFCPNTPSCRLQFNKTQVTEKLKATVDKRLNTYINSTNNPTTNFTRDPFWTNKNWTPPINEN